MKDQHYVTWSCESIENMITNPYISSIVNQNVLNEQENKKTRNPLIFDSCIHMTEENVSLTICPILPAGGR